LCWNFCWTFSNLFLFFWLNKFFFHFCMKQLLSFFCIPSGFFLCFSVSFRRCCSGSARKTFYFIFIVVRKTSTTKLEGTKEQKVQSFVRFIQFFFKLCILYIWKNKTVYWSIIIIWRKKKRSEYEYVRMDELWTEKSTWNVCVLTLFGVEAVFWITKVKLE
jgi:hypothetical protein